MRLCHGFYIFKLGRYKIGELTQAEIGKTWTTLSNSGKEKQSMQTRWESLQGSCKKHRAKYQKFSIIVFHPLIIFNVTYLHYTVNIVILGYIKPFWMPITFYRTLSLRSILPCFCLQYPNFNHPIIWALFLPRAFSGHFKL